MKPHNEKHQITLFLVSQNLSLFGSQVVSYAIIWYITLTTSSGLWLTLATVCSMLPQAAISLWGGVFADRYSRKHLIMLADGFIAAATLGLAVAFSLGFNRISLLLAVSVIRSVGAGIQTPAVNALYPQLVPKEHLTRVQGINQTLGSALLLIAPAVGGIILGTAGIVWAFLIDVATALAAILIMVFLKADPISSGDVSSSILGELRQGISYTIQQPALRRIIICYACSYFLFTPAATLAPLLIERTFGHEVWHLAINQIVWSAGSLMGGIVISIHGDFHNKTKAIATGLVCFGITLFLQGISPVFGLYLLFIGIAGFILPFIITLQTVYIQETVHNSMLGRVFSFVQIISVSAMPVAILLFGPLADLMAVQVILLLTGALLVFVGIAYDYSCRRAGADHLSD